MAEVAVSNGVAYVSGGGYYESAGNSKLNEFMYAFVMATSTWVKLISNDFLANPVLAVGRTAPRCVRVVTASCHGGTRSRVTRTQWWSGPTIMIL